MFFLQYNTIFFSSIHSIEAENDPHAVEKKITSEIAKAVTLIILVILVGTILATYSITGIVAIVFEKTGFSLDDYVFLARAAIHGVGLFIGIHFVSVGLESLKKTLRGDVN